ncbi:GNAT family N-acetyltransferase [Rubinisphaera margarita]|uniref:GNAT family N-acetyltransferase n=1 Tax=Rubinisphaera margarita TaxID=2909586 RepID=UPI001EE7DEF0|nr:GNAT family N-acetyltransferase [Rubinisphaera margarita]MCG6154408.1 GNAT family N-acetyltransferase [Rubinisphaera margarita]
MKLTYHEETNLNVDEFIDVLQRSTLAERRPIERREIMEGMLRKADILVGARTESGQLVGIGRALSDFAVCTYLADLAVDVDWQGHGIGTEILNRIHDRAGRHTKLILLAAPKAVTFYPHIGLEQHPSCWIRTEVVE